MRERSPKYTYPTCVNDSAVWHLSLDTSRLELCERCIQYFRNPHSHVNGFALNCVISWRRVRKCT